MKPEYFKVNGLCMHHDDQMEDKNLKVFYFFEKDGRSLPNLLGWRAINKKYN